MAERSSGTGEDTAQRLRGRDGGRERGRGGRDGGRERGRGEGGSDGGRGRGREYVVNHLYITVFLMEKNF